MYINIVCDVHVRMPQQSGKNLHIHPFVIVINIESIFPHMTAEWQSTLGIWLLGPANYVIRTESLWAVDPMLRHREAEKKVLPIVKNAFAGIRFILISHLHSDHYSLPFLVEMCTPGVSIVLPDWIGEFYAYYQWYYNIPSIEVCRKIPVSFLKKAYHGLHDLELDLAVQKVGAV